MLKQLLLVLSLASSAPVASGQWIVGGGYQHRTGDPSSGVDVRLERQFSSADAPWFHVFVRGQGGYFFKQNFHVLITDYEARGWSQGYHAAGSVGAGMALRRFGFYAGIGGGYEHRFSRQTVSGFPPAESLGEPAVVTSDLASRYGAPHAGIRVGPFHGLSVYAERLWPWYMDRTLFSETERNRTAVGVSVQW